MLWAKIKKKYVKWIKKQLSDLLLKGLMSAYNLDEKSVDFIMQNTGLSEWLDSEEANKCIGRYGVVDLVNSLIETIKHDVKIKRMADDTEDEFENQEFLRR